MNTFLLIIKKLKLPSVSIIAIQIMLSSFFNILPMTDHPTSANLFLFIGLPGSGKTTVCKNISHKYSQIMIHQSVGDLLRAEAQHSTQRGQMVHQLLLQGELVPIAVTLSIIDDFLLHTIKPIILLDGYQGTTEYIEPFQKLINSRGIKLRKVIYLDVPLGVAFERSRNRMREDDKIDILKNRIQIRSKNLEAITKWYDTQQLLVSINGANIIEAVTLEIERLITDTMTPLSMTIH